MEIEEPGGTVELHAAGLGLMFYSPGAALVLAEGADYFAFHRGASAGGEQGELRRSHPGAAGGREDPQLPPGEELREPLRSLVDAQAVVLLGTGSPQLDYVVHVRLGAPLRELASAAAERTRFGLGLRGGALCVRDGYDPMDWSATGESLREVTMPDGYYAVDALWIPEPREEMVIHLFCTRTGERVAGDGWPYLPFSVTARLTRVPRD